MTDTRKDFEEWARLFMDKNERAPFSNEIWQACQSLNDKRIQQLFAVIAKKDLYLGKIATEIVSIDKAEDAAIEALSIKPENVELVEAGGFIMHEDKFGTRYPSSKMSYSYDEFEIGVLNKLYTIKTKASTK